MEHKIKIGITQGDINGTSYEIMLKTFQEQRFNEICTPIVYGSPKIAGYYRKTLNINNFNFNQVTSADDAQDRRTNLVNVLDDTAKVELGHGTTMSGEAAVASLKAAVADFSAGKTSALILNPINTRMTAELGVSNQFDFVKQSLNPGSVMTLLVNDTLRVALLSDKSPMRDISKHITIDNIVSKLHILSDALKTDFAIDKPKIAVLGFNPGCMDSDSLEREESDIIVPAIAKANEENVLAMGPYSADVIFGTDLFRQFDAVLSIYYEQGLVPFRALSYDDGVSYLLGMPQLCVAPFQTLGYDDAGLDKAEPTAFQKAIYLACDVLANREQYKDLTANPLKKHNITD
ncbi:MAG: 4-hydroxythreonine-4-phosphate dehydrogenase PdxA [Salinivirgaceae bacterium]|nr:4-hydroxythreonine-4-phosphate dehydrogenase PdxA [Salinivirgaceae bacterium]MBR4621847.1 4-hydroxythreonine-4-phosphate dehydrogenase PdxA [Salinivirgaceae bacterium]